MKRVVCVLSGHRWVKRRYKTDDSDGGHYLHCLRCGKDNHDAGQLSGHMGSTALGGGFG